MERPPRGESRGAALGGVREGHRLARARTGAGRAEALARAASSPTRLRRAMREAVRKYSFRSASRVSPFLVLRVIFIGFSGYRLVGMEGAVVDDG